MSGLPRPAAGSPGLLRDALEAGVFTTVVLGLQFTAAHGRRERWAALLDDAAAAVVSSLEHALRGAAGRPGPLLDALEAAVFTTVVLGLQFSAARGGEGTVDRAGDRDSGAVRGGAGGRGGRGAGGAGVVRGVV